MHRKAVAATIAAVALSTGGCSAIADQLDGRAAGAAALEQSEDSSPTLLATRQWGVVDGLLSVVVQNVTDRTLRYAAASITARADENEIVAASIEADSACCEIVDLAPGAEYGFYLDVGDRGSEITEVSVGYRSFSWAPVGEVPPAATTVRAEPVRITQDADGVVVRAALVSDRPREEVIAQAFLTDRSGEFLAVVSGRWSCLTVGRRVIDMELFHPLPAGAQVDRVVAHPVSDDPTRETPDCRGPGAER